MLQNFCEINLSVFIVEENVCIFVFSKVSNFCYKTYAKPYTVYLI